jgi:hypothetical protein
MKSYLKALGLALVAALAISALAAGAAQAENATFTAEKYPAVAKGEQEGPEDHSVEVGRNYFEITPDENHEGERFECDTAQYQATLTDASHKLTVTPHYDSCTLGGTTANIALNGCHFEFETHGTEVEGDTPGTAALRCPAEESITISGPLGICVSHVGEQEELEGITFTNKESGDVTVHVEVTTEIKYTHTDTVFCPWEGGGTASDGGFVTDVTMEGFEDTEELVEGPTGPETTYGTDKSLKIDLGATE